MKKLLFLFVLILAMMNTSYASALSLSLLPSSQTIPQSGSAALDLVVSGLGSGGPDSLGAFDVAINFDNTLFVANSVTFGDLLGDPLLFEAVTGVDDSTPGVLDIFEVSLLNATELDSLQPSGFALASILFDSIDGAATSAFDLTYVVLSDAGGSVLNIDEGIHDAAVSVPEPSSLMMLGITLLSCLGFALRRNKIS